MTTNTIFSSLVLTTLLFNVLNAEDIIETQLGPILGIERNNYYEFRGLPFTQVPPIGSNRFTQSTVRTDPYTQNDSTYDATISKPACLQPDTGDEELSEDW